MTGEKSGEFRGKSVEAAVAAGLSALRLNREDVEVEIVRPGSRGVLGIGAEDAVVRLTSVKRGAPEPRPAARTESQESRPSQPARQEPKPAPSQAASASPATTGPASVSTPSASAATASAATASTAPAGKTDGR